MKWMFLFVLFHNDKNVGQFSLMNQWINALGKMENKTVEKIPLFFFRFFAVYWYFFFALFHSLPIQNQCVKLIFLDEIWLFYDEINNWYCSRNIEKKNVQRRRLMMIKIPNFCIWKNICKQCVYEYLYFLWGLLHIYFFHHIK